MVTGTERREWAKRTERLEAKRTKGERRVSTTDSTPSSTSCSFVRSTEEPPFSSSTLIHTHNSSERKKKVSQHASETPSPPLLPTLNPFVSSFQTHKSPRTIQHIPVDDPLLLELVHSSLEPSGWDGRLTVSERSWDGGLGGSGREDGVEQDFGEPPEGELWD